MIGVKRYGSNLCSLNWRSEDVEDLIRDKKKAFLREKKYEFLFPVIEYLGGKKYGIRIFYGQNLESGCLFMEIRILEYAVHLFFNGT